MSAEPDRAAPVVMGRPSLWKYFAVPGISFALLSPALARWSGIEGGYAQSLVRSVVAGLFAGALSYLSRYLAGRLLVGRMTGEQLASLPHDVDTADLIEALGNRPLPPMAVRDRNDAEWRDERNWRLWHTIYFSRRDTRLAVPKWDGDTREGAGLRESGGMTLNSGHPGALFAEILVLLAPIVVGVAIWMALRR